ncbi:inositol polyphosphate 5-phosphatase [Chamberlinius hualienensis]
MDFSKGCNSDNKSNGELNGKQIQNGSELQSVSDLSLSSPKSLNKLLKSSTLVKIPVTEARSRNFLVGCSNSWGSLLGAGNLSSHFPDHSLTLFVGTYNVNETASLPSSDLSDFLLPESVDDVPDLYAIGTQENTLQRFDWEVCLQETIGLSHVLLHSALVGTLHLAVFIRKELIWFCSEPEEGVILTRQGSMIKTKGAVAIALQIFGTSFLFVNSHLTAHEENVKERISDHEKIKVGMELPRRTPVRGEITTDVTARFDCVFWFGDLNFRLKCDRHKVLACLCGPSPALEELMSTDQLNTVMVKGAAFQGFSEAAINFPPTYKYDIGTDAFDTSEKRRTPSYTDRILYRMRKANCISCLNYNSVPSIRVSDHKPVYSVFKVHLRPGRDDIPLSAGLFNRNVYLKVVAQRAVTLNPLLNLKNSKFCSVM